MIAHIALSLAALAAAAPALAKDPLPEVVQAPRGPAQARATCAPASPAGRSDVVTCALTLPRIDPAPRSLVLQVALAPQTRVCAAAQVIQLGPAERTRPSFAAEDGARRSKSACQPARETASSRNARS